MCQAKFWIYVLVLCTTTEKLFYMLGIYYEAFCGF